MNYCQYNAYFCRRSNVSIFHHAIYYCNLLNILLLLEHLLSLFLPFLVFSSLMNLILCPSLPSLLPSCQVQGAPEQP